MADTSNQYTKKTIEALTLAKQLASKYQAPEVGVVHVLRALFDQPDSFYVRILEKLDIDPKQVSQMIDSFMNSVNKVQGGADIGFSSDLEKMIEKLEISRNRSMMSIYQ